MKKLVFLFSLLCSTLWAQQSQGLSSNEIYHEIQKLNFLGNVLYVAAHPDDENTKLISYFANQVKANTTYISLTRGDGGQNLIGGELGEQLGMIRTQELLKARGVDGGKQLFSRAFDFGFSKVPQETFAIWDKQQVLDDLIQAIKDTRADVIINRFDHRTPGTTHGHHTASAILSVEACKALEGTPYAPKRLFYNLSPWAFSSQKAFESADKRNMAVIQTNVYYPLLGKSNGEIAALSRTQHMCQGFGTTGTRETETEYLEILNGTLPNDKSNVFEGIDTSWNRIEEGATIGRILSEVENNFNFKDPSTHVPDLLRAYRLIEKIKDPFWRTQKSVHIKKIILACSGIYLEAKTATEVITHNSAFEIEYEVSKRSAVPMQLTAIKSLGKTLLKKEVIKHYSTNTYSTQINRLSDKTPLSTPYWLRSPRTKGMFVVEDASLRNLPEIPTQFPTTFVLNFSGTDLEFTVDTKYKFNSPKYGEVTRPILVSPSVSLKFSDEVLVFADLQPKTIQVIVKSHEDHSKGTVTLEAPKDWMISPSHQNFSLDKKSQEITLHFTVTPNKSAQNATLTAKATINNQETNLELIEIDYPHIPKQSILKPSQAQVVKLDIQRKKTNIGYVMGSSDAIPQALEQIGYKVTLLQPEQITLATLQQFETVLLGIRAYNTNEVLAHKSPALKAYVEQGGNLIMQYVTTGYRSNLNLDHFAPYALEVGRSRVTEEDAKVDFINPNHPVLQSPNRITPDDFKNWVQERGLYFAHTWDSNYTPILSMHDTNEPDHQGSLLIANYGKGHFVYTGLSFFRQLPKGVPGAYRLLVNLIEL